MALGLAHEAAHGGDDDDGGVLVAGGVRGCLEEGKEGKGGEVNACDVCVEDGGPVGDAFARPELLLEVGGGGGVGPYFGAGDAGTSDLFRLARFWERGF